MLSSKNVIDAVESERNLNQIGSFWRKMTIIANGHVGICAPSLRDVMGQWNLGYTNVILFKYE